MTVQDGVDDPGAAAPADLALHQPGPRVAPDAESGANSAAGSQNPGEGGADGAILVPSGQRVVLQDVVRDVPGPDGAALRFRFLAPAIAREGGTVDVDQATEDMAYLCKTYAIQRATGVVPAPTQIIISMSDIAVPFGDPAPEATQYFEAYRIVNGTCVWEGF